MNHKLKGTIALLLAAASYGLYGSYSKFLGPTFGPFTQNWVRGLLVTLLITIFLLVTRKTLKRIEKNDWKWILAWNIGALSTVFIYISFNNLPIGTAYFLLYATMIGTGFIGGRLLFGEKITARKTLAIVLSLLGLFIIYYPNGSH